MCGIAGVAAAGGVPDGLELVRRMCDAQVHRGPDSFGSHVEEGIALGMRRLQVIDLQTGDQPIFNEAGDVAVVMNGEIYNFRELRESLRARGHRFATESDTEVIVHLYEEHGDDCVSHLNGMFAFALWDRARRRLLLGRDRLGKKPLLYAAADGRIAFASEFAALLQDRSISREVDSEAIDAYLAYRYVPAPLTAFRAVRKLPPGCTLSFDAAGMRIKRYWQLRFEDRPGPIDEDEVAADIRDLLRAATRRRLISDVPLGAFLSGGIDSAAVVAAMAEASSGPVKTFSIGFESETLNELPLARVVAERFGTEHHELMVEPDAMAILPKLVRHHGEPFADPTTIPTYYLAEMASRHVTVALNGDGGDEAFGGYTRYVAQLASDRLSSLPAAVRRMGPPIASLTPPSGRIDSLRSRVKRAGSTMALSPAERYLAYMTDLQGLPRASFYTDRFAATVADANTGRFVHRPWEASGARSLVDRMLAVDNAHYLPDDLLAKVDIATMASSLEGRSPLLDYELVEYVASLPASLKVQGNSKKRIFRRALEGWVPDEILKAPKRGFQPPIADWFRGGLSSLSREVLLDPATHERGFFRPRAVERMLDQHARGSSDNSQAIWTLLMLELWHREVVEGV